MFIGHFLTDFISMYETYVLPGIVDHKCTQMSINMNFVLFTSTSCDRWNFGAANWKLFYQKLATADWRMMDSMDVNDAVLWLNTRILAMMSICIPKLSCTAQSTSHPWLNETCFALIRSKNAAEGTGYYSEACKQCSEGMYAQYLEYVQAIHVKLKKLPTGGKKWWKLSHKVLQKPDASTRIPPLCKPDGSWAMDEQDKADVFGSTFREKWVLPDAFFFHPPFQLSDDSGYFVPVRPTHTRKV